MPLENLPLERQILGNVSLEWQILGNVSLEWQILKNVPLEQQILANLSVAETIHLVLLNVQLGICRSNDRFSNSTFYRRDLWYGNCCYEISLHH